MLNILKVKYMTMAAAYENGAEKKNLEISKYFRGDYLGLQMIKSAVAYVIAFCILVGLWAMGDLEELMLMLSREKYVRELIKILLLLFVSGLVIYEGSVYFYYSKKYQEAKKSLKGYKAHLKKIDNIYKTQESAESPSEEEAADKENVE